MQARFRNSVAAPTPNAFRRVSAGRRPAPVWYCNREYPEPKLRTTSAATSVDGTGSSIVCVHAAFCIRADLKVSKSLGMPVGAGKEHNM